MLAIAISNILRVFVMRSHGLAIRSLCCARVVRCVLACSGVTTYRSDGLTDAAAGGAGAPPRVTPAWLVPKEPEIGSPDEDDN